MNAGATGWGAAPEFVGLKPPAGLHHAPDMTDRPVVSIPKWPFILGDVALLALAVAVVQLTERPFAQVWQFAACFAAVAGGAALAVWPFILEHRSAVRAAEAGRIADAIKQFKNMEIVAAQIGAATARWQMAQDAAEQTTTAAKGVAEKIASEARAFQEFLAKTNDGEKATLRLEVEKLQRAQGEWLQLSVHTLDHIFALHQAAVRSGQPNVIKQLEQFQHACRDLARRLGVIAVVPAANVPYNPEAHQLADAKETPDEGALVSTVLAPGYTFQGRTMRKPLVALDSATMGSTPAQGEAPAAVAAQDQRTLL
jgi:molecular chaperone GrpE (heat shock protein)